MATEGESGATLGPGEGEPSSSAYDPAGAEPPADTGAGLSGRGRGRGNMLPGREGRRFGLERVLVRLIATAGIIGIGVLLGAILADNKVQGWITGLVVAAVSVVLAALLWSSRQL